MDFCEQEIHSFERSTCQSSPAQEKKEFKKIKKSRSFINFDDIDIALPESEKDLDLAHTKSDVAHSEIAEAPNE